MKKAPLPPNPHPRKNFYNGPWLMLRPVFFCALGRFFYLPCGHESFAVRRSWDACAARDFAFPAWGKGGLLGAVPLLGPLCTPPGTPRWEKSSISSGRRGHASCAVGASFPRGARSGDLPPRRVNARGRLRFGWGPFQPNTTNNCDVAVRFLHLTIIDNWRFSSVHNMEFKHLSVS